MGRPTIGKHAMTNAERQRRHRAKMQSPPKAPDPPPADAALAAANQRIAALLQEVAKLQQENAALRSQRGRSGKISDNLWRDLMLCLHPDGKPSEATRKRAFIGILELEQMLRTKTRRPRKAT